MTPSSFRLLVNNFTTLTSAEYAEVESLSSTYPYCQILHVLAARASNDLHTPDQQHKLHRAAIYATDRSVVKRAMTTPAITRIAAKIPVEVAKPKVQPNEKIGKDGRAPDGVSIPNKPAVNPLEGDALREDLSLQLNRLQKLKRDFEASYEALKHSTYPKLPTQEKLVITSEPPLIEEIKATRKKLKVPSPKVAEQGEIIDQFIKVAPTLPKAKATEPSEDLAKDSVNYSDNIVSETLVNILVKQGKTVKAIEMLKKLIWKFPQKKAYFAAQIEALKN